MADTVSPSDRVVTLFPPRESLEVRAVADRDRALEFVAHSRALLIRAEDEDSVCQSICDAALDLGDYTGAWIARANTGADGTLHLLAVRGITPGMPTSPTFGADDQTPGLAGARLALRERRSAIFSASPTGESATAPERRARKTATDQGLALPVQVHGEAWGVLVLYSRREHALAARAVQCLTELAADLGCRLGTLRDQRNQFAAAQALRQSNLDLQARLRDQNDKLARTTRALQAIRHSIAHDLRAPLRSIDGFAHILDARYASRLDQAARGYLERMRNAAQRLGAIIEHTLHLGHLANIRPRREKVNLAALAQAICTELGLAEPQRNLQAHIEPNLYAHADAALMQVALRHLFENAWEHTRHVAAPSIEFGAAQNEAGNPIFFVRDNGTGFDMRYSGQLFKAFSRLTLDSDSAKLGVGLATVARIIELHGGAIWATSRIGEGATFYFELPLPK